MTDNKVIQLFSPTTGPEEQAAAAAAIASGWIGFGPQVLEFEMAWAEHIGVPAENVVSVSCATEGLYQIMAYLAVSHHTVWSHDVIVPDIGFIGIANAVRQAREGNSDDILNVVLCDVDPHTLNPSMADIALNVKAFDTLAVVIQHYGGVPSDLGPIAALCRERGVLLIEDAACAPLSFYGGQRAGTVGDFGVWSFDAMKIITSGDGGMVYCRDAAAAESIRKATRLGQDNLSGQGAAGDKWWEYRVYTPGRKAMLNDLQAAVGLAQLVKLEALVERRHEIWNLYSTMLCSLEWLSLPKPYEPENEQWSYYTFWVQCEQRDALALYLRERGVYTSFRYWPISAAYGCESNCPNAAWAAAHTLNLPLHANLTDDDVISIVNLIYRFGERQPNE